VVFGLASLLPALLLPAYGLLGWLIWSTQHRIPALTEIHSAFTLALPLGAALAAAHLMTIEREENFDALRRSYPEPAWRMPLARTVGAVLFMVFSAGLSAVIFRFIYGPYEMSQVVLPAVAPALYLMGLALLTNNLVGSSWVSTAGVVGYWYMELQSMGAYTGSLFLFNDMAPLPGLDPAINRALLVTAALFSCMLNIGYSVWRRRQAFG
jgi:ABC-type transport system involved in multi-copper enzyme maturation permease subunit